MSERSVTESEALEALWRQKSPMRYSGPMTWVFARVRRPVTMHDWNGKHPYEENTTDRLIDAGDRVFVPMVSRMGDVGIRDTCMDPKRDRYDGYSCRVMPEDLYDWTVAT